MRPAICDLVAVICEARQSDGDYGHEAVDTVVILRVNFHAPGLIGAYLRRVKVEGSPA